MESVSKVFARNLNEILISRSMTRTGFLNLLNKNLDRSSSKTSRISKTKYSRVTVDKWLAGTFVPSHEVIDIIAKMFDVSPGRFFYSAEDNNIQEIILRDAVPEIIESILKDVFGGALQAFMTYQRLKILLNDDRFSLILKRLDPDIDETDIQNIISDTSSKLPSQLIEILKKSVQSQV